MPEQPRKRFTISQYAGLQTNENAHFIAPNAAQSLLNVDFVEKGQFACRQGILPVWPSENPIAPVSYLAIASVGYSTGQAEILVYETRDGALHYSISPATGGSGNIGAPTMRTGLNTFAPMTMVKVPDGFLIGQNGYDRGLFWDGLSTTSYNLGMDAPASAPTVTTAAGGNATAGQYLCFVRFIDQYKTASNLSPAATVAANQGDEFAWTVPVSSNPRTTQVELWRTTADENETYYLVATVKNGTASYTDTMSDDGLEQQAVNDPYFSMANEINGQPNANRFGIPPTWKSVVSWFQDRCFYLADQNYTLGTVSVINGSSTVYGSGVAWPILMSGLYLYVVGATVPYLIDNVTNSPLGVTEINRGGGSTNAVQLVTVESGVTSGHFTLSLNDAGPSANIAYNAPATGGGSVQAAIGGLANVGGTANVGVTGSAGGPWTVTFQSALAGTQEPAMTADSSGLSGLSITVTELQAGGASSGVDNAIEIVGFSTADGFITGGEFTLTFEGHTTPPLPALGTTAGQMTSALEALPSIGSGNVSVSKTEDVDFSQEWQITFIGFLAGINVPQMTITCYPTSTSGGVTYTGTLEPENYTQVTGAVGANEIQQIKLPSNLTGGTFTLTWSSQTTTALAYNCSAQDVTNALVGLAAIGSSANIAVTGGLGTFNVVFQGTLGGASQTRISGDGTNLKGGGVSVEVLQGGGSGTSGSQTITLPAATSGYWTITIGGATTPAINWNASNSDVQAALEKIPTVGTGNVTVSGTYNTSFTLTFGGSLVGQTVPQCTVDASNLCGAPATVTEVTHGCASCGSTGGGQATVEIFGWYIQQNGNCVNTAAGNGPNGSFTVSWNGHTSAPINLYPSMAPAGQDATQMTAILTEAFPAMSGNILVAKLDGGGGGLLNGQCGTPSNCDQHYGQGFQAWQVSFIGSLTGPQPQITVDLSGITDMSEVQGFFPGATLNPIQCTTTGGTSGGSCVNEVQLITLPTGVTNGTFKITAGGITSSAITFPCTVASVQSALGSNFTVNDGGQLSYLITYSGASVDCQPWSNATVDTSNLCGGVATTAVITQGAPGGNEVQLILLGSPTGGSYTLTWNGDTTTALNYDATADDVQAALNALADVSGDDGTFHVFGVTFGGSLGGAPQVSISGKGTPTSGDVTVTVTELQSGIAGTNAVQTITLPAGLTCGTWTFTLNSVTSPAIAYNAPATGTGSVQNALQAMSNIGSGNVSVSGSYSTSFTLTFGGSLSDQQIAAGTVDGGGLCGFTPTITRVTKGQPAVPAVQAVQFGTYANSNGDVELYLRGPGNGSFAFTYGIQTGNYLTVHPSNTHPNNPPSVAAVTAALNSISALNGHVSVALNPTWESDFGWGNGFIGWLITVDNTVTSQIGIDVSNVIPNPVIDPILSGVSIKAIATTNPGTAAVNEVQQITLPPGTSGGTFTITAGGVTTGAIAWNAPANGASSVQSALGADFSVTGSNGGPYTITYINSLGGGPQSMATVDTSSLTGISTANAVAVVVPGSPTVNELQRVVVKSATASEYTLTWNGDTTTSIAFAATASDVQTALNALLNIGGGTAGGSVSVSDLGAGSIGNNISVISLTGTGDEGGSQGNCYDGPVGLIGPARAFLATFEGSLGDAWQPLISINSSLTGPTTIPTLTLDVPYAGPTQAHATYSIRPAPFERNRVYFSASNEPESVPPTNLVRIQHDQNVDDDIVGAMPFNGALYILKQNHVYSLTYVSDPLVDVAIHCVAYRGALNNSCCALAEGVMFLMDEWGAYAFDGTTLTKIGDQIQNYWRDSLIDFTRAKWFYVKATPQDQTVRFFVCFPGFCYPAHAFAYNYRLGTWSLESYFKQAATAAYLNFDGQSNLLLGTTGEVFYQIGEGTLDGTQGAGTIRGTATTGTTSAAIFCATTTWPADSTFASITIDSGGAKGQTRAIVSADKGLAKLTLDKAFTGQLKGDTYVIGGIPWNYKTPIYRFLEVENENRRELRVSFLPTDNPAMFDTQRFYDHDSSPQTAPSTYADELWGLSWLEGSPDITADMCNTQSLQTQIVGFVPISDNERLDDRTEGPRWMTYLLRGVQAQDRVKIVGLEIFGMETG